MNLNDFMNESGFQRFNMPDKFTPNFVLAIRNGKNITVSDVLSTIEWAVKFIKANFNVNQNRYAETLKFLSLCRLRFVNQQTKQPNKQMAHLAADVFHEMRDMVALNDEEKRINEGFFMKLDFLIDIHYLNNN